MTGAWKGGLALANATSIGAVTSGNSTGTVVITSASTYTKGAWVPLTASTTIDINWVCLYVDTENTGGSTFAVDIGVGTLGNEVAVVTNLCYAVINVGVVFFPLHIAAGSRVVARHASKSRLITTLHTHAGLSGHLSVGRHRIDGRHFRVQLVAQYRLACGRWRLG